MTSIMNQVTCSLCDVKIDESQWKEHLISTEHLQVCKDNKGSIVARFFNIIFKTYHNRKDIYNLKGESIRDFWELYFATKISKEKFDILCKDPINDSELETSLTCDLLCFISDYGYFEDDDDDDDGTYLNSLDKVIRCRICDSNIHQSCLLEHIISKKHRDTENYFISKCMTYCEKCHKEIKNDEWRQHLLSDSHVGPK